MLHGDGDDSRAKRCNSDFRYDRSPLEVDESGRKVEQSVYWLSGLEEFSIFRGTFNRPNMFYQVQLKTGKRSISESTAQIRQFLVDKEPCWLKQEPNIVRLTNGLVCPTGIVYCLSRNDAEAVAKSLSDKEGIRSLPYHAGHSNCISISVWQPACSTQLDCGNTICLGMEPAQLRTVHELWMKGKVKVGMCRSATRFTWNNI